MSRHGCMVSLNRFLRSWVDSHEELRIAKGDGEAGLVTCISEILLGSQRLFHRPGESIHVRCLVVAGWCCCIVLWRICHVFTYV